MHPLFDRGVFTPATSYWQVQNPLRHWLHAGLSSLHLIFFSRHRRQALPLIGLGGDIVFDVFRMADGEEISFPFFVFFGVVAFLVLEDFGAAFFDVFFLAGLGLSGAVDVSKSGSW